MFRPTLGLCPARQNRRREAMARPPRAAGGSLRGTHYSALSSQDSALAVYCFEKVVTLMTGLRSEVKNVYRADKTRRPQVIVITIRAFKRFRDCPPRDSCPS
jgi:hypothetical protein